MKKQKKDPLYKSFGYAFAGIFAVVTKERNMKIHCVAMVCVVIAGFVFHITPVEWCICLTLFGLVMALEMVNTAVESSGRSGHGREKAACKACQRCSSRSSTDRGNHGSNCRDDHIYSKAFWKACLYRHRKENDLWKN